MKLIVSCLLPGSTYDTCTPTHLEVATPREIGHRNCRPHSMRMLPTKRQQMLTKFIFISFSFFFFFALASPSHLPSLPQMRCSPLPVSVDACMRMGLRRTSFCPSHSLSPCIYLLSFRTCASGSDGGVLCTQVTDRWIFVSPNHIKLRFKKTPSRGAV